MQLNNEKKGQNGDTHDYNYHAVEVREKSQSKHGRVVKKTLRLYLRKNFDICIAGLSPPLPSHRETT